MVHQLGVMPPTLVGYAIEIPEAADSPIGWNLPTTSLPSIPCGGLGQRVEYRSLHELLDAQDRERR
jgi:hypothetical protein